VGTVEEFLVPQIEEAARYKMLLERFFDELINADLLSIEVGSQGQTKTVANPLLAQYDKMHRSLAADLTALGLNYNTTPSKVTENTKKDATDDDPLAAMYREAKQVMENY
jgi:hypothetical protein